MLPTKNIQFKNTQNYYSVLLFQGRSDGSSTGVEPVYGAA